MEGHSGGGTVSLATPPALHPPLTDQQADSSRHSVGSEPPELNHRSSPPAANSSPTASSAAASSSSSSSQSLSSSLPSSAAASSSTAPPGSSSASSHSSRVVVNLPVVSLASALSSPLSSLSSLSAWPAPSPHSSELVHGSLAAIPAASSSVRGLISHVFLLRADVWEVLERWSQMPQLDPSRFQPGQQSPLLIKVWQKRDEMDSGVRVMAELAQHAQLDRMERGKRTAGGAGGRGNRARTLLGYDGTMRLEQQQQQPHEETNATVLSSMRRIHANTAHSMQQLTQALQSAFPSVHASLAHSTLLPSTPSSAPTELSLEAIVSAAIRRCSVLYGSGGPVHAAWSGMHVERLAVASTLSAAAAAAAASDWSPVVHLLVSLPAVMRVQVALSEAAQPAGPLLSVRVLGWDEQLLPLPFSSHSSHTGSHLPSLASSSSTPPSSSSSSLGQPSHTSLSSRHVLQLVQAQLTAHLHRCNSLLSSSAAVASLSHCPLFHFLLHLASYHSLFESACVGCGAVLAYHSDSAKLLPAVVRSVGGASSLHAACLAASTADVPNQSSHTTPTHTPPPAGNSKGAGSGSGSSATVQAATGG